MEIQNTPKTKASVEVGEFCLVEDLISGQWYRGQVRNENADGLDVFLIDHGNVLSVDISQVSSCSNDLFGLPPKIVCGFFSNVLPLQDCWDSVAGKYLLSLIGKNVTGYIHALLPHKVLILEATDINKDLVRLGFGKHVDTDTFLLLVQMLREGPLEHNLELVPDLLPKTMGQNDSKSSSIKGLMEILSFSGPEICAGTCIQLKVTAAVNPGLFYCQMSSAASDLQAMSERLTAVCHSTMIQTPQDSLGLLCSVKGKDGKWYRGFLQCLPVNSQVQVLFVDYGYIESVRVENILRLPPEFLSMPIMSFPCTLPTVTEHNMDWKQKQLCLLKKGILRGVLDAKIMSLDVKGNIYSVEILCNEDKLVKEPELTQELSRLKHEAVFKCVQVQPQGGDLCCETVMAQVLCSSIKAEGLTKESTCVGYVVHTISPNDFSLRTDKRNADFEVMVKQMAEHFSQVKLNEQVLENPQLGTMCCAMYERDRQFYRAVIKHKLDYGAQVLFIDFGNTEKVPYMLIKKVPEKFVSQAAFALSCSLGNIMPLTDVWTSANSQFFREAVSNRSLMVHVIHQRKDKVIVDLFTMESKTNWSIAELLISWKQAESWKCTQSESVKQDKSLGTKTTKKRKKLMTSTQPQNVLRRDEKTIETLACTPIQQVTPKLQDPIVIKKLKLKLGCEIPVRCTQIKCPSDFWCQVSDNLSVFKELMAKIQQYYSTHTVPVHVGAPFCIAKSPEDGKWYRAYITEGKSSSHITVLLVDNGTTLQVEMHKLQQILPEYSELEAQAFRCSLYNLIEPIDPKSCGQWSTLECTLFRDFVQDHSLSLTCSLTSLLWVKGKQLCTVVDLHSSQLQHSITELLIGQGLARPVNIQSKVCSSADPASFSYSSFNLSCGNEELVYVTHISGTWDIYCQLDRNSEIIEELETKISEEKEKILLAVAAPVKGMCLAKYFDGRWYRGLAKPAQSSLYLAVFFVDYGNTCIVEKTNVLSIPNHSAELLYTPIQAVRCSLARVQTKEPLAWATHWLKATLLNVPVRAVVVEKLTDGSVTVELFDGDVHINNKVNEHIVSLQQTKGHLTPVSKVTPKQVIPSNSQIPPCIAEMPTLSSSPNTSLKPGLKALCYASHINTVCDFFLQLQEDEPDILNMREVLNASRASLMKCTPRELDINNNVLAEYDSDGALYRAVLKSSEGDCFKVEFLDYGNLSVVRNDQIYSMTGKLVCRPRFSIPCSLLNRSSYEKDSTFRDDITDKPLMVEFVGWIGTQWHVKIEILDMPPQSVPLPDGGVEPCSVPEKQEQCELYMSSYNPKAKCMKPSCLAKKGNKSEVTVSTKDKILVPESSDRPSKSKLMMSLQKPGRTPDNTNACLKFCRKSESYLYDRWLVKIAMNKLFIQQVKVTNSEQLSEDPIPRETKMVEMTNYKDEQESNRPGTSLPQQLSFASINMGQVHCGFATTVTTPFNFHIVLEDSLQIMNKVSTMLEELPSEMPPLPEAHFVPGLCCLVYSDTKCKWCRAEVVLGDETVVINLVDYGHCTYLPYSNYQKVKILPEALKRLPKVTYPCSLRGVNPVSDPWQWTDEAAAFFQERVCHKDLQIFFWELVSDGRQWEVDVLVDGNYLSKELVDAGHANYIDILLGWR